MQGLTKRNDLTPNESVMLKIIDWCEEIIAQDFINSHITPSALLPIATIRYISTLFPLNAKQIEQYLAPQWYFWTKYGADLVSLLTEPKVPEPENIASGNGQDNSCQYRHEIADLQSDILDSESFRSFACSLLASPQSIGLIDGLQ
jgi:hypothetical protein